MPKEYKFTIPSLREMVVSKTYPGAPSDIRITVFPTKSVSRPDKFSLFSSSENAYFGKLRDTFQEAVEAANKENLRMYGPIKGEQAGMLGVPGKVHTQKRPYEAGQMEIESYAKYKEAMSPKLHGMLEFLISAPQRESTEAKLIEQYGDSVFHQAHEQGFITRTPNPSPSKRVVSITLKGREALQSTPAEKEDLHWKTVVELKQMCSELDLPTDGGKEDLIRRLKTNPEWVRYYINLQKLIKER